jgi:hypothetical protein
MQLYSDDDFLVDGMQAYICDSLDRGNGAICVASKQHLALLAVRMKTREHNLNAAAEEGRYVELDVHAVVAAMSSEGRLNENRATDFLGSMIEKITTAIQREKPRVVFFGEISATFWDQGNLDDVLRLEQFGNELALGDIVTMRCPYPMQAFRHPRDTEYLRLICGEHSAMLAPEGHSHLSGDSEPVPVEIPSDRLLTQEQRLVENEAKLVYPEWQGEYRAAMMEMDLTQLFKEVEVAQAAVLTRLHELQHDPDHYPERHQLMRAWRVLQIIKKEKLGFIE